MALQHNIGYAVPQSYRQKKSRKLTVKIQNKAKALQYKR